jgi:hypothetical protein
MNTELKVVHDFYNLTGEPIVVFAHESEQTVTFEPVTHDKDVVPKEIEGVVYIVEESYARAAFLFGGRTDFYWADGPQYDFSQGHLLGYSCLVSKADADHLPRI